MVNKRLEFIVLRFRTLYCARLPKLYLLYFTEMFPPSVGFFRLKKNIRNRGVFFLALFAFQFPKVVLTKPVGKHLGCTR